MTLKLVLIGCGHIATQQHGPALRAITTEHPDVRLAACCDLDTDRAASFARKFGFARSYTDSEDMLRSESPDGVILLVPHGVAAASAVRLIEQGCNYLLMEKPPGVHVAEARMIQTAAERRGANVMVAFNRRHMPVVRLLKSRLAELDPVDLHHIRYELIRHSRPDPDFSLTAIHGLDTAKYIAGSAYANLRFRYRELPEVAIGAANIEATGAFASGTTVDLQFFPMSGISCERVTVFARDMMIVAELPFGISFGSSHVGAGNLAVYRNGELAERLDIGPLPGNGNGFNEEIAEFLTCLRNGTAPQDDVASTYQSVETAACIRNRKLRYYAGGPNRSKGRGTT